MDSRKGSFELAINYLSLKEWLSNRNFLKTMKRKRTASPIIISV